MVEHVADHQVDTEPWIERWMHQSEISAVATDKQIKDNYVLSSVAHDEGLIDKLSEKWSKS